LTNVDPSCRNLSSVIVTAQISSSQNLIPRRDLNVFSYTSKLSPPNTADVKRLLSSRFCQSLTEAFDPPKSSSLHPLYTPSQAYCTSCHVLRNIHEAIFTTSDFSRRIPHTTQRICRVDRELHRSPQWTRNIRTEIEPRVQNCRRRIVNHIVCSSRSI